MGGSSGTPQVCAERRVRVRGREGDLGLQQCVCYRSGQRQGRRKPKRKGWLMRGVRRTEKGSGTVDRGNGKRSTTQFRASWSGGGTPHHCLGLNSRYPRRLSPVAAGRPGGVRCGLIQETGLAAEKKEGFSMGFDGARQQEGKKRKKELKTRALGGTSCRKGDRGPTKKRRGAGASGRERDLSHSG